MTTTTSDTLTVGARIKLEKGCKARGIDKGCSAKVTAITPMGPDYGHCVRVTFMMLSGFKGGKAFSFYARHMNRLADAEIRMNDGNPSHTIEIRRAS